MGKDGIFCSARTLECFTVSVENTFNARCPPYPFVAHRKLVGDGLCFAETVNGTIQATLPEASMQLSPGV